MVECQRFSWLYRELFGDPCRELCCGGTRTVALARSHRPVYLGKSIITRVAGQAGGRLIYNDQARG